MKTCGLATKADRIALVYALLISVLIEAADLAKSAALNFQNLLDRFLSLASANTIGRQAET